MDWKKPSSDHPVWCAAAPNEAGVPTAQSVSCVTQDPTRAGPEEALLEMPPGGGGGSAPAASMPAMPHYQEFTSQDALGHYLLVHYKIKSPRLITSCETCHR